MNNNVLIDLKPRYTIVIKIVSAVEDVNLALYKLFIQVLVAISVLSQTLKNKKS